MARYPIEGSRLPEGDEITRPVLLARGRASFSGSVNGAGVRRLAAAKQGLVPPDGPPR